jgi:hypothetical protein
MAVHVLQEPSSIEKIAEIDEHIGCAMSGLTADAKTLIDHARADTQVCTESEVFLGGGRSLGSRPSWHQTASSGHLYMQQQAQLS